MQARYVIPGGSARIGIDRGVNYKELIGKIAELMTRSGAPRSLWSARVWQSLFNDNDGVPEPDSFSRKRPRPHLGKAGVRGGSIS
ncbi:MAG: hypothetical protein CVV32_12525 [Methanomicrobiales archaeon HGW-Methanomicrobiales-3]|nr:MAG: hypothetical protein CVV32_12525 [Methanomicrobiales archaeon HGW-Methanomicrobiales-3]